MKVIVIATRTEKATKEAVTPLLEKEAKTALGMMADDFVREIYGRADGNGAILVCEASGEDEVREKIGQLPFAQKGFLDLDIYPVVPYRGIVAASQA